MPIDYGNPIDQGSINRGGIHGAAPNQLGGAFNYGLANSVANQYGQQAASLANRQIANPYSGASAYGAGQARDAQLAALQEQQRIASGQQASVAELQYRRGMMGAAQGQQSAAASVHGGGPAMAAAQRAASWNNATGAIQGANDMGQIRAQEMQAARDRYAQGLAALRQGDQGMWGIAQGREMQQAGLNDQGALQSQGMAGQMLQGQLNADSTGFAADEAARQAAAQNARADRDQWDKYKMGMAQGGLHAVTLGAL